MHKLVGKSRWVLPYVSPYLSSIPCGCVKNIAADAAGCQVNADSLHSRHGESRVLEGGGAT